MARFLFQIYSGPEAANKATLGCLIALTATQEGHAVSVVFVGDGVHLLAPEHGALEGQGTGKIADHLSGLMASDAVLYVSQKSAEARGYGTLGAEPILPPKLVALAAAADTVMSY